MKNMRKLFLCILSAIIFAPLAFCQTGDCIAHTMLVADYDYVCHTSNADGQAVDVSCGLVLQVGEGMACTMGRLRHSGENDNAEQLLYVPTTWQNYPEGKTTSLETVPPYQYLTSEALAGIKWTLAPERDTIAGFPCQKATGKYAGVAWTAWFAESLPTQYGPWRLHGLPGLIMRAESSGGIHHFECRRVEAVKEAIAYSEPEGAIKCGRTKFVKLRNRTFGNANYLANPTYYIKPDEISQVTVVRGMVVLGDLPINMKPAKFQPIDF